MDDNVNNIVDAFKHIKKFTIEITVDTNFIEINNVIFSNEFNHSFDGLERADLLVDLIHHLNKDRDKSFMTHIIGLQNGNKPKT